jgi:hypothetical protein
LQWLHHGGNAATYLASRGLGEPAYILSLFPSDDVAGSNPASPSTDFPPKKKITNHDSQQM